MTFPIPDGVRRLIGETFEDDEARRYREEADAKLKRLQDTPMAQLGPDEPLNISTDRPKWMGSRGYDTPDFESTADPTLIPEEGDGLYEQFEADRQYSGLGPSPALSAQDIAGDPIPAGSARDGAGGPENGPLSEATITDIRKAREARQSGALRQALVQQPGTADDAAKDLELAEQFGVNRGEVASNRKSFEFSKTARDIDALKFTAPRLRTWLDDARENLEIAHDDIDNLSWWETAGRMVWNSPGAFYSGMVGLGENMLGLGQTGIDTADEMARSPSPALAAILGNAEEANRLALQGNLPRDPKAGLGAVSESVGGVRKSVRDYKLSVTPQGKNDIESGYYSGLSSLATQAPLIAMSVITGNPAIATMGMSMSTAGEAYSRTTDENPDLSFAERASYALRQAGIEFATELVPNAFIVEALTKGTVKEAITDAVKSRLAEHLGEQAATTLQDLDDWMTLHPDGTWREYIEARPSAALQTFVATLVGVEGQMIAGKAAAAGASRVNEAVEQQRSETLSRFFKALGDTTANTKLLKRLPEKHREVVAKLTEGGPAENVRVTPEAFDTLAQESGVAMDALAQAFRIDPADIESARATGEDVVIRTADYATALGAAKKEIGLDGTAIHNAFSPHMRLRAEDFTAKEREAMKAVYEEEQKARTEVGTKEQAFADSADRVRESIREQVVSTGLFNTETANTQASLIGEMVTTLAERTGQDPEAFWDEHGFDIVTALTGEQDDQSLAQGLQRQAVQVDDATVLDASEKLPPHEFEVWKEAIKGGSNDEVTDRLNENRGPDNLMEPKDVARIISRIREKGFEVQKLRTGPALSPETLKIIDLKARGLDNAAIGKAVFPHLSPKERAAKARTASNNNRKAVDARRAELQLTQEKRGTFTPRVGRSVIRLFESANLSTLVHEASHWYLDTLWRMANIPAATPEAKLTVREGSVLTAEEMAAILNPEELAHPFVLEQVAAILEWQGKSPNWTAMFNADGTFTAEGRDIQEAFAETFEAYLREGKAPTSALRSVFASFKAWLLRIYKSLTQIGSRVKLNDEIRAVFDRMLATDEAIKAEASTLTRDSEAMAKALLEKGVITPKQVDKTRERLMAAKERAEAELMARLMEDYERNQKSWWKDEERQVRREVQSEIDERPEQRAYAWLSGKGWRATRAGLVEEAAAMADAMASLEQYDEALAFSRYYEPDATDENLKRLQERMRSDGVDPVIMLFKAPNGRIIAFQGSAAGYSHDLGREIMGLGDLKLQHGIYDPRKGLSGMQGIDWYATTGTLESLPKSAIDELAQFAPRNAQGAPIHSLLKATLMDIGGESKEDIWRETGWAQTRHGDWVWEIPGKPQFNFNPEAKAQRGRLDQMIEWPELFDAMPILRDVYLVASVGAQSGRFDSAQAVTFNNGDQKIVPLITARGSVAGSNTLMETIQHEIQHAIQTFSGFASTGATAAIEVYRGTEAFEKAKARFRNMEAKLFEKYGDASPELFEPLSEDEVDRIAALEVYSHNHGEWQARQVEWRSRMPAEWRWANPPGTEVPGTKEDVDERRTWATLADLRSAQGVQRSGDADRNPAARVANALVGDQAPAVESAGANDGQDNGSGSGSGSLAQRVGPAERAAEIQRVLDYLKANPEAARDVSLSALMAATDASAIGADLARRQFRQGVSLAQARRMAAIDAGVQLVREYLATHPNAFDTMRVGEIARAAGVPVEAVQRAKQAETGSLAQLSNAGISALREFVESPLVNTHVQIDNYEVYLRKARRVDETGKLVTTLDMASIQRVDAENASFEKGRAPDEKPGDFRELVQRLEQEAASHGFDAVYAENVFNEFLPDVLQRYGYTQMPGGYPPSFIKHVGAGGRSLSQTAPSRQLDAMGFYSAAQESAQRVPDNIWNMGWQAARNALAKGRDGIAPRRSEIEYLGLDAMFGDTKLKGAELKAAVLEHIAAKRLSLVENFVRLDPNVKTPAKGVMLDQLQDETLADAIELEVSGQVGEVRFLVVKDDIAKQVPDFLLRRNGKTSYGSPNWKLIQTGSNGEETVIGEGVWGDLRGTAARAYFTANRAKVIRGLSQDDIADYWRDRPNNLVRGAGDIRLPGENVPLFEAVIGLPEGVPGSDYRAPVTHVGGKALGTLVTIHGEERTDDKGQRTLFAGQVQSDQAQRARENKAESQLVDQIRSELEAHPGAQWFLSSHREGEVVRVAPMGGISREEAVNRANDAFIENRDRLRAKYPDKKADLYDVITDEERAVWDKLENAWSDASALPTYGYYSREDLQQRVDDYVQTQNTPLISTSEWTNVAVRSMIYRAAREGFPSISFPTAETSEIIQGNDDAAQHYETNVKGALEKIAKQLGGEVRKGAVDFEGRQGIGTVAVAEDGTYRTFASGLSRETVYATADEAWAVINANGSGSASAYVLDITPAMRAKIMSEGFPLFQQGDTKGRTAPPPNLPPMRLDLQAVKEQYGEQALAALPPEIVAYSAAATDLDQFVEIAVDVRRSLKKKRPKSLWKFLSTRRVIGSGNDKIVYAGIRDEGGELLKIIGEKKAAPGLIADETKDNKRVRSYSIEHASEAAWEAGYFTGPSPPTPTEFLDALRADVDGQAVRYSANDAALVQERESAERWEAWFDENGIDITSDPMFGLRDQLANVLSGQQEHAIGPDEAAEYFRMPDGNALLQGLKEGAKRNQLIREETQRRMIARHGDIFRDGTLAQEAAAYARNEIQHRQFEIELDALARATGQQAASNLAKQQAIENLRSKQVREVLNFNQWLVLERRWSKKAVEAAERGDVQKAAEYARYRLINSHMYTEGRKLAEKIEASRKHILDYGSKTKQQRLYHAGKDYAEQMNGLLTDYQFRNETRKGESKRAARAAWLQSQMTGLDPYAPYRDPAKSAAEQMAKAQEAIEKSRTLAELSEGVDAKNYKSLTVEEMMAVKGEADLIWKLATLKDKLVKEGDRRKLSLAEDDVATTILHNHPMPKKPEARETAAPTQSLKRGLAGYWAMHRTLQALVRDMDGNVDGGVVHGYFVRPLNESFSKLVGMKKKAGEDLKRLFSVFTDAEQKRWFKDRIYFGSIGESLTKQGRLSIALNWGNYTNRKRLMDSTGWTEKQVGEILDTLTERDWKFVQSIGDYLDTYYAEANRVHENVHGLPMDKVEPAKIATRFGVFPGFYFPIHFDPFLSSTAGQRQLEKDAPAAQGRIGVRTEMGSAKKRVKGRVTLPLKLSVLDVVVSHLDEVTTSIATEEALFDVGRLVKRPKVEDAIVSRYGRATYNEIINVLKSAKFGLESPKNVFEHFINHVRNGATIVGLGWKVATAALQPVGVTNSIVRVGGFWMMRGYARMGVDPWSISKAASFASARSDFMKHRMQSNSPELTALRGKIKPRTPGVEFMRQSSFWLMSGVQYVSVDLPTWLAQHEKSTAAGRSDEDASAEADQAVIDAQGGGELHQIAGTQRGGPLTRLFSNFASYMLTTLNLATNRIRGTKSPLQAVMLAMDLALLLSVPVAAKMALDAWTKGGGDDDDEDLWEKYFRQQAAFLIGPFLGINQFGSQLQNGDYGYRSPAGLGFFAEAAKPIGAASDAVFDAIAGREVKITEADIRGAGRAAGILFHLPEAQIDATIRGALAMWKGEETDPKVLLFGPTAK